MIFYGTKGSHLKSEKVSGVKCSHCEQQSSHTVSVFGRYAYIYWIPVFPLTKKGVSECDNCKATLERKEMSEQLKMKFDNVMRDTKTPLTYWAGAGIIALLIAFGIYSAKQHEKDVANYILEPAVGDVYEYKVNETGYYSTVKIVEVTNDSIFVIQNNYETDKKSGINDIDKEKNYTTEPYSIGKDRIQSLFDDNVFYDINR